MVYEFQHSPIHIDEVRARTQFYKSMVWIVNGRRRVNDVKQFASALHSAYRYDLNLRVYQFHVGDTILTRILSEWWDLAVPVAFDFGTAFGDRIWVLREPIYKRQQRYRRRKLIWQGPPILHSMLGYFLPKKEFIFRLVNEKPLPNIEHDGEKFIAVNLND